VLLTRTQPSSCEGHDQGQGRVQSQGQRSRSKVKTITEKHSQPVNAKCTYYNNGLICIFFIYNNALEYGEFLSVSTLFTHQHNIGARVCNWTMICFHQLQIISSPSQFDGYISASGTALVSQYQPTLCSNFKPGLFP